MYIGILVSTARLSFGEKRVNRTVCILEGPVLLIGGVVKLIVVLAIGVLRCRR